jgi:hypothetical protein
LQNIDYLYSGHPSFKRRGEFYSLKFTMIIRLPLLILYVINFQIP